MTWEGHPLAILAPPWEILDLPLQRNQILINKSILLGSADFP